MNNILQNSNIEARYHLAATLDYNWKCPQIIDGIAKLIGDETITRARYLAKADQIVMISEPKNYYGPNGTAISEPRRAEDAASSVMASTSISGYVAAHEAAHNFGCQHSREQIGAPGTHAYAVGANNAPYCTVMSYGTEDAGIRVPIFSSPTSVWKGVQLGSATQDNARKFREFTPTIVNFGEQLKDRTFKPEFTEWRPTAAAQKKNLFVGNDAGALTAKSDAPWLTVTPDFVTTKKDVILELTVTENKDATERTGIITIGGFYPEVKVTVTQSADVTSRSEIEADNNTEVWCAGKEVHVQTAPKTRIEVYSSLGKLLFSEISNSGTTKINLVEQGIYIVKLIKNNKDEVTAKVKI